MRFVFAVCLGLPLIGCAMNGQFEPPIVDERGVSHEQFVKDQGECVDRAKANTGFITAGAPITACMRERGYTILAPKS